MHFRRPLVAIPALIVLLLLPRIALAHAHLLSSTPAANATVHAGDVAIELRYNSRVDGHHSVLTIETSSGSAQIFIDNQSSPSNLNAHARLKPGSYTLKWQALSTDGHITRGEIPFTVR
jgi:methionine-rich copper-binding protein CopC